MDASKADVRLEWAPRLTSSEALDLTIEWYRRFDAADRATADLVTPSRSSDSTALESAA